MQSDFITDYHNNRSTKGGKVAKTISFAVLALFGIVGYAGYKSGSTQVHNTQLQNQVATNLQQQNPSLYGERVKEMRGDCPQSSDAEFQNASFLLQILDLNEDLRVVIDEMAKFYSVGKNIDQVKAQIAPRFRMMDQNSDGFITLKEICSLQSMNQSRALSLQANAQQLKEKFCPTSSDFVFNIAQKQMQIMDRDYNQKVTVEEFQSYIVAELQKFGKTLNEQDMEKLKLAFAQADLNSNGKITLDEFCASVKVSNKLGLLYNNQKQTQAIEYCPGDSKSSKVVSDSLRLYDTNKDGIVSLKEFQRFYAQKEVQVDPEDMAMVFRSMSGGQDFMTIKDMCDFVQQNTYLSLFKDTQSFFGNQVSKTKECQDVSDDAWEYTVMFQERYDKNQDGIYTFEECYNQVRLEQPTMTAERFRYEFNQIDHNFDGRLTTSEVCHQIDLMIREFQDDKLIMLNQ